MFVTGYMKKCKSAFTLKVKLKRRKRPILTEVKKAKLL